MENNAKRTAGLLAFITVTATLGGFLFGFDTAVISGTIRLVTQQFGMGTAMEGWYVSSALLGCIAGVAISGRAGDSFGRKKVMLAAALLFAISAIGAAFSSGTVSLIFFRLIGGIGIGVASVVCPMYLAELAPPKMRGKLIAYYQLAITIGILVAYFSNALVQSNAGSALTGSEWKDLLFRNESWRGMYAVGIIPALLFFILIFFIPESPRWLAMREQPEKAEAILCRINDPFTAREEIRTIRASVQEGPKAGFKEVFHQRYRKPLFIGVALAALSQFSGINAIIYYGPSILEKAGFRLGEALGGQVTIGIVNTLFTLVAIFWIEKWGRRPLLMAGIGGAIFSLVATAVLFALHVDNGWLILTPVILFIACFAFSFGPVTWVIISEIFPTSVRSSAVAISTMALWVANWLVGQFFPMMLNGTGPSITFLVFAGFSAAAFYISWKMIPETKGKSLESIHA